MIDGVSCASSTSCTAVGSAAAGPEGPAGVAAAEHWDGTTWSPQTVQQPHNEVDRFLTSVSCTSSKACTAIGSQTVDIGNTSDTRGLVERWNGRRWRLQSSPTPQGAADVFLSDVSCGSKTACTAVGWFTHMVNLSGTTYLLDAAMAERWDGTGWSLEALAEPRGVVESVLTSVSCTTSTGCAAVGDHNTTPSYVAAELPMVERSSGTLAATGRARLADVPALCVREPFTVRVTGMEISSVKWFLDDRRINGRVVHRHTRYAASIRLSARSRRHRLTVKVRFATASHTHARTLHANVLACRPSAPEFTGLARALGPQNDLHRKHSSIRPCG